MAAGTKTAAGEYERKPLAGIGEREPRRGAILPQPKQTDPRNRGNYPGHTLHRRGNIELDVTVARATRCVLVRDFEHACVAFTSVPLFLRAFFSGDAISRSAVIAIYPDGAFRSLSDRVSRLVESIAQFDRYFRVTRCRKLWEK